MLEMIGRTKADFEDERFVLRRRHQSSIMFNFTASFIVLTFISRIIKANGCTFVGWQYCSHL